MTGVSGVYQSNVLSRIADKTVVALYVRKKNLELINPMSEKYQKEKEEFEKKFPYAQSYSDQESGMLLETMQQELWQFIEGLLEKREKTVRWKERKIWLQFLKDNINEGMQNIVLTPMAVERFRMSLPDTTKGDVEDLGSLIKRIEEEKEYPLGKLNSKELVIEKRDEQFYFIWNQAIDRCIQILNMER